jgi:hypothetical protein
MRVCVTAELRTVMISLGLVEAAADCVNNSYSPELVTAACTLLGNFCVNSECSCAHDRTVVGRALGSLV